VPSPNRKKSRPKEDSQPQGPSPLRGWLPVRHASLPWAGWLAAGSAIAAVALLVNFQTLRFAFVSWDDSTYVTQNPWIRDWSWENLRHIFTKPYFVSYMPIQLVSYMLDHSLWGLKPFGYHLQQILLHALDSVLAFELVRRLLGRFWLAFIAALLFAVHPSHVESVAWISARKDVLSAAFLFPSVIFYLLARGDRSLRPGPYAASIVFFTLAVLSKVNVVVMPLFLLLVDWTTLRPPRSGPRWWIQVLGTKVPYGAIGLGVMVVNWIVEVKTNKEYAHDPLRYLVLKGHATWDYLGILAGVHRQNPIYDTPPIHLDPASAAVRLSGLLLLPALVWWGLRVRHRVLAFGAGWMLVMLLPAMFFPVPTYVADRYLYHASLGFCWLLAAAILGAGARIRPPKLRLAAAALLTAGVASFFAVRTVRYNRVWAGSESLWSYTIQASRDFRAFNNLARVRIEQNRWDDAERLFKLGARQVNVTSWEGLTVVYYKTGRYAEALQANDKSFALHAQRGKEDRGELAELYYKRGSVLLGLNRTGEAIQDFEKALQINPGHTEARKMMEAARSR